MNKVGEQVVLTCHSHKTNRQQSQPSLPGGRARLGWGLTVLCHAVPRKGRASSTSLKGKCVLSRNYVSLTPTGGLLGKGWHVLQVGLVGGAVFMMKLKVWSLNPEGEEHCSVTHNKQLKVTFPSQGRRKKQSQKLKIKNKTKQNPRQV